MGDAGGGVPLGVGEPGEFDNLDDGDDSFDDFDIHSVVGGGAGRTGNDGRTAGGAEYDDDNDDDDELLDDAGVSMAPGGLDGDEEEPSQFLPDNHPLLAQAQTNLEKQLQDAYDKLVLEIRGKREECKRYAQEREEMGVELYRFQKQLATAQEELDKRHEMFDEAAEERQREELKLQTAKENNQVSSKALSDIKATSSEHEKEVNRLNGIILRVKQHQTALLSAIATNKREWYKGEGDVVNLEKAKLGQDLLVDELTEKVKAREDKAALTEQQIEIQRSEAIHTQELLDEASGATEEVVRDTAALETRWKQAIAIVQKRDEAVSQATERLNHAEREARAVGVEIGTLRKTAEKYQGEHEVLTATFNRVVSEAGFIEKKTEKAREGRQLAEQELTQLTSLLESTDQEAARLRVQVRAAQTEVAAQKREGDNVVNVTKELEEQIAHSLQQEKTLDRASASSQRAGKQVMEQVAAKQQDLAALQNELSRLRVDQQHIRSQKKQAQEDLGDVLKQLKERDELAERYEVEIRRRAVEVERKQSEVDRLNKKLDTLKSRLVAQAGLKGGQQISEGDLIGPLEATIHHIQNEIEEVNQECQGLQARWLRTQTDYVALNNTLREATERCSELDHELTMLTQKALRLTTEGDKHERDYQDITKSENRLRHDMERLQHEASKRGALAKELEEGNLDLEVALRDELRTAEEETAAVASKTQELSREHDDILSDIVEASRLVLLWEKKIALARETTAAIDPTVGAAEVSEIQSNIKRLQAEFTQLKLNQRQLLVELDRSVSRRSGVVVQGADRKKQMVKHTAKATARANAKEREFTARAKAKTAETRQLRAEVDALQAETAESEESLREIEDEAHAVAAEIDTVEELLRQAAAERNNNFRAVTVYQSLARKYGDLVAQRDLEGRPRDEDSIRESLAANQKSVVAQRTKVTDREDKILTVVDDLDAKFGGQLSHLRAG
jgi:coiled-coil domain-containing protein 40